MLNKKYRQHVAINVSSRTFNIISSYWKLLVQVPFSLNGDNQISLFIVSATVWHFKWIFF